MNLRACLNPRVLTALGIVAVGVALFAPRLTAALPILAVLACPLSMLAMGWAMRRHHTSADSSRTWHRLAQDGTPVSESDAA